MRVTQSMLSDRSLRNLSQSYQKLAQYQEQLSTGKKISRPSDDPVVAMKGMFYRTNLTEVEQFQRNLSEVYTWMDNSESGLDQANSILQRTRELVVQANSDTNNKENRQAIAREIEQLKEDMISVANTQIAGRYIFNGTNIGEAPVTFADGVAEVDQNTEPFQVEVSSGVHLSANINPKNTFPQELFDMFQQIQDVLNNDNTANMDSLLGQVEKLNDNLSAERSELGARYNRLELVESRLNQQVVIASKILSDNEDADMERVITDLMTQENVHKAALGVSSRLIQPSLMDFLR